MIAAVAATPVLAQGSGPYRLMPAEPPSGRAPSNAAPPTEYLPPAPQPALPPVLEYLPPVGGGIPSSNRHGAAPTRPVARPPQITPSPRPSPPPQATTAPSPQTTSAPPQAFTRPTQVKEGIEVNRLDELDPETVGALDARAGGLGIDLWQGARRAFVVDLVLGLPSEVRSWASYDLMRRLLLSNAKAPAGAAIEPSLVAARVGRLTAIGDLEGASTLAAAADARALGEPLARARLDALLLRGETESACEAARDGIGRFADPYWQKATAFCQATSGEAARAMIGVDLLRESGEEDKVFFALAGKLLGYGSGKSDRPGEPRALDIAMMRAADLPLSRAALSGADPGMVRAIATSPNAPFAVRLEAAERALAANALDPDVLAQLYMAAGTAADGAAKGDEWTPARRAALYRAAASESNRAARAAALARFWSEARKRGDVAVPLRVGLPLLDDLPPSPEYLGLAADAARALLSAGRNEQAQDWYLLQVEWARSDSAANEAASRLWPLIKLADVDGNVTDSEDSLVRWWERTRAENSGIARGRGLLLFLLLDAVGEDVPAAIWDRLASGNLAADAGPAPAALVQRSLAAAGGGPSRGETVAMALIATEGGDGLRGDAAALHAAVRALVAAGLERDARRIAVEAAIAAGL